jgi:cell shape-determining protein MreC
MKLRSLFTKKSLLTAAIALSLAGMLLPARLARWPGRAVQSLLTPLGDGGMFLTTGLSRRIDRLLVGRQPAPADSELLLATERLLAQKQRQINALRKWRRRLPRDEDFLCRLIEARVVGVDGLPLRDRRLVNAGRARGVAEGDLVTTRHVLHPFDVALPEKLLVLGRNYAVGRIVKSAAHTATLQLLTDPGFSMPAVLWRMVRPGQERKVEAPATGGGTIIRKIAHGGGREPHPAGPPIVVRIEGDGERIVLRHVPKKHGIRPGDLITSSETDLVPSGMAIAEVVETEVEPDEAHFVTVYAEPLADLDSLRYVYIVMPIARPEN